MVYLWLQMSVLSFAHTGSRRSHTTLTLFAARSMVARARLGSNSAEVFMYPRIRVPGSIQSRWWMPERGREREGERGREMK